MQRKQLTDGLEVQIKTGSWSTDEAVIVSTDVGFAHRVNHHNRVRTYSFDGNWDQAIAVAVKDTAGNWRPKVTTTRRVLATVADFRVKEQAEQEERDAEHARRAAFYKQKEIDIVARLGANPTVVVALNEFVGSDSAFVLESDGKISVNSNTLVRALTEALGLEVIA